MNCVKSVQTCRVVNVHKRDDQLLGRQDRICEKASTKRSPHSSGFQNTTHLIREQHREETLHVWSELLPLHTSRVLETLFVAQDIEPHFDLPSRDIL